MEPEVSASGGNVVAGRPGAGRLIVVCGLPGSGKTTLSRRMAEARRALRLCPDEWMDALGVSLWDADTRSRVESLQWDIARDMLSLGMTVIVEWGAWGRAERDALREGARALGAAVELHYLDVPVDELWRRVRARGAEDPPMSRAELDEAAAAFQAPDGDELALFDPPVHAG